MKKENSPDIVSELLFSSRADYISGTFALKSWGAFTTNDTNIAISLI